MRTTRWLHLSFTVSLAVSLVAACGGTDNNNANKTQCNDGIDNDGDGLIDFPDDPGCTSETDTTENSLPSPQCSDGRDNDNDGKIDFPNDPGCTAANQDSETDDCPSGPHCPQCSNGKDDDNNGVTDYPNDPGCTSAADPVEVTDNPAACGANVVIQPLPANGQVTGMLDAGSPSGLFSPTCGGGGAENVYEIIVQSPKVIVASTDVSGTTVDTVLYLRPSDCTNNSTELTCNDDAVGGSIAGASTLTYSVATPGVYYLVVDAHDSGASGTYKLQVDLLAGEGELCDPAVTSCGPGLVCRIPLGGTMNVCSQPMCNDGVDDDGDGKNDYPNDPGCTSPDDNDETDTCPGAGCPQCADGIDNDGDGQTDYPNDLNCTSASGTSESCLDTDAVMDITAVTTSGTTVGLHNDTHQACGSTTTTTAPDKTYRLRLTQKLDSLAITTSASSFSDVAAVYGPSCGGTALSCQSFDGPIALANINAGDLFLVIDGYSSGSGTFTITTHGVIKNGESCEGALVTSGVLACSATAACAGTAGAKTCVPAQCSDGIDNDNDGKTDYPFDPGCASPADNDEANPTTLPVCGNALDDDSDGLTDFPADFGCSSAAGTSEVFCSTEHDAAVLITGNVTTGTTVGKTNDETPTCTTSSTAVDVALGLYLPVPVKALQVDTIGSAFDTVLSVAATSCVSTTVLGCNDDGGSSTTHTSKLNLTNVGAGNYAVLVDGYMALSGAFTLNVNGTVAAGVACTATAFTGANAYLKCETGLTCTAGKCQ